MYYAKLNTFPWYCILQLFELLTKRKKHNEFYSQAVIIAHAIHALGKMFRMALYAT